MANSSINLVDLDFNGLKQSFKDHLASQARYKDYDFDGSNISVLLDVLAYNSYLNTFYLNMVASEMFLDTAQLRDSIVSHAKELNYLPRSFNSAYANVNVLITPSISTDTVIIPSKTSFTARVGSETYNFVTNETITINSSNNGVFYANNLTLYEGVYVTDTFVKNSTVDNQRFILTNQNIDTSSLELAVTENSGANVYTYTQASSLFGLNATSPVFFVQACENEQYEIVFGSGGFGRPPLTGAVIEATYRVCNGELPNGADTFINNSSIDGHSNVSVVLNESASGGSISESIESIKFNAPRNFQVQERAITESDYETLLMREFSDIQAVSVYGGEKENPPQYGKVFVAVNLGDGKLASTGRKKVYGTYLKDRVPLGFSVDFVDPQYVYLSVECIVKYNTNLTTSSSTQLQSVVSAAITNFSDTYLDKFNADFRYSNFVTAIDAADQSILNNDTVVTPYVVFTPTINRSTSFNYIFNAPVLITTPSTISHPIESDWGLISTSFVYDGYDCILEDDGSGNIRIVKVGDTEHIEVIKVGTINYDTGAISITGINVSSFSGSGIKIYVRLTELDYSSSLRDVLTIKPEDISITMIAQQK